MILLALLLALPARAERAIQIGVVPSADKVLLACEKGCAITDSEGRARTLQPQTRYQVEATEDGLKLGSIEAPAEVKLAPRAKDDAVSVDGKRYRGSVILRRNPHGAVTAVEEIGIEDYLVGVLPYEMDPGWPLEALKAQAVVARTFAYTQLGKYRKDGFDLTGDTRSQVYKGSADQYPSVVKAVESTRGEVLGYKGEILNVYYHACCGGHTADAGDVWPTGGATPRPLKGVRDKYCDKLPSTWTAYFRNGDLLDAIAEHRDVSGRLRAFSLAKKDMYGYALYFLAKVGENSLRIKTAELRQWLGASVLRSARITRIKKSDAGVEFRGKGNGHGVGLCQWGAKVQAERGRRYEKILGFYFPGSTLSVVDE